MTKMKDIRPAEPKLTLAEAKRILAQAVLKLDDHKASHPEYKESVASIRDVASQFLIEDKQVSRKRKLNSPTAEGKEEEKEKKRVKEFIVPAVERPGPCPCINCAKQCHIPGLNVSHPCPNCSKTFQKTSHLRSHMLVHTTVRDHTCTECAARFKRHDQLVRHLYTHDTEKAKQRFRCRKCKSTFTRKDNFKIHIKRKAACRDMMKDNNIDTVLEVLETDKKIVIVKQAKEKRTKRNESNSPEEKRSGIDESENLPVRLQDKAMLVPVTQNSDGNLVITGDAINLSPDEAEKILSQSPETKKCAEEVQLDNNLHTLYCSDDKDLYDEPAKTPTDIVGLNTDIPITDQLACRIGLQDQSQYQPTPTVVVDSGMGYQMEFSNVDVNVIQPDSQMESFRISITADCSPSKRSNSNISVGETSARFTEVESTRRSTETIKSNSEKPKDVDEIIIGLKQRMESQNGMPISSEDSEVWPNVENEPAAESSQTNLISQPEVEGTINTTEKTFTGQTSLSPDDVVQQSNHSKDVLSSVTIADQLTPTINVSPHLEQVDQVFMPVTQHSITDPELEGDMMMDKHESVQPLLNDQLQHSQILNTVIQPVIGTLGAMENTEQSSNIILFQQEPPVQISGQLINNRVIRQISPEMIEVPLPTFTQQPEQTAPPTDLLSRVIEDILTDTVTELQEEVDDQIINVMQGGHTITSTPPRTKSAMDLLQAVKIMRSRITEPEIDSPPMNTTEIVPEVGTPAAQQEDKELHPPQPDGDIISVIEALTSDIREGKSKNKTPNKTPKKTPRKTPKSATRKTPKSKRSTTKESPKNSVLRIINSHKTGEDFVKQIFKAKKRLFSEKGDEGEFDTQQSKAIKLDDTPMILGQHVLEQNDKLRAAALGEFKLEEATSSENKDVSENPEKQDSLPLTSDQGDNSDIDPPSTLREVKTPLGDILSPFTEQLIGDFSLGRDSILSPISPLRVSSPFAHQESPNFLLFNSPVRSKTPELQQELNSGRSSPMFLRSQTPDNAFLRSHTPDRTILQTPDQSKLGVLSFEQEEQPFEDNFIWRELEHMFRNKRNSPGNLENDWFQS